MTRVIRVTQQQLDGYFYFHEKGLHEKGAAAPIGNFVQESGEDLDPTMFRAHPDASGGVAQALKSGGVAEWLGDRKTAYIAFSRAVALRHGLPPERQDEFLNDRNTQYDFVIHELTTDPRYADLYRQLTTDTGRSVATLTANFMMIYERPKIGPTDGRDNRVAYADAVYKRAQLIKDAEGQPTPIPVPQQAPTAPVPPRPIPQAPPPPRPIPTAPVGPSISASTAGRQAAGQSVIETTLANLYAERASIEDEISVWETAKLGYKRLPHVPAIDAPLALPKPDEDPLASPAITTKRSNTVFGKSWITSVFGVGSIGAAIASIGVDIANKQMPDWSQIFMVISSLSAGGIGLAAKDNAVTGGTISAVTGARLNQPVSVVDDKMGGTVPSSNSRYDPKTGKFL